MSSRPLDPTDTIRHDVLTLSACRWGALLALCKRHSELTSVQAAALQLTVPGPLPVGAVLALNFIVWIERGHRHAR